jgi:NAD+ synthase (glutamine-hydrolysing)
VEFERFEEFERAVSLGLWDYMRKSGSHGFVISLSGGADSAACAYLVQLMVLNGIRDIGAVPFLRSIGLNPDELQGARVRDYMSRILTCVYQGTENSSETTRTAARAVAEEIGAEYHVLDVQPVVDAYRGMISAALGCPLTWENADVALQNIQARVRAPSVWMFANLKNALLVTTSNRSEASVGYCTMDGDTAGSLAPIGGIDKPFIREWLASRVKTSPALRLIIEQQPTAELRPASEAQIDEKDLMPYEVLDAAEKALVIGKKSPLEVYRTLRAMFPVYTRDDIRLWVERYFTLWCRNQWKRERFAPSLHLDDENLDPKTWCRFPILSGGYRDELAALNKAFAEGL